MANFIKRDVVVIPIPFSDLSGSKRRPALVLCNLQGQDIILCQITSQNSNDMYSIPLVSTDFENGNLPVSSNIRPGRIFTADKNIIIKKTGTISDKKIKSVIDAIHAIIC